MPESLLRKIPSVDAPRRGRAAAALAREHGQATVVCPGNAARKGRGSAPDTLARALRALPRPALGRVSEDRLVSDLRCLEQPEQLAAQLPQLREALSGA